jgi:hypothetical protein
MSMEQYGARTLGCQAELCSQGQRDRVSYENRRCLQRLNARTSLALVLLGTAGAMALIPYPRVPSPLAI